MSKGCIGYPWFVLLNHLLPMNPSAMRHAAIHVDVVSHYSLGKKLKICEITSTVHQLPSILYLCVSETHSVYKSGKVCNLSHSIGVSFLILGGLTLSITQLWLLALNVYAFSLP